MLHLRLDVNILTLYVCRLEIEYYILSSFNTITSASQRILKSIQQSSIENVDVTFLTSYLNYPSTHRLTISYVIIISCLKLQHTMNELF